MTTDRETEIADLLLKHPATLERNRADDHLWQCLCGQIMGLSDSPLEARHRNHLASVLAAYITDREAEAAAKALNEAADTLVSTTHMPDQGSADLEYAAKFMRQRARGLQANPFRFTPDTEGEAT